MEKSLAERHVELLTGDAATACNFRLIHDKDKSAPARKLFGSLNDLWPEIAEAQAEGYGVFIIPNSGGDTDAEIKSVRALFIDVDGTPFQDKFHVAPSFIVQRDDTHWHAYWLLGDELPTSEFTSAQKRLITYYGSDKTIHNLSRVMRLAGSDHHKGEPVLVKLWDHYGWGSHYTTAELLAGLPDAPEAEATIRDVAENVVLDTTANIARATAYAKTLPVMVADAGEHTDDFAIEACRKLGDLGVSERAAAAILYEEWGVRCKFDRDWIETKASNAYKGRENALGVDAVQTAAEAFKASLAGILPPKPEFPRFYFYSREEFGNWQPPEWLVPDIIPGRGICLWFGKPGSYKSFLALDTALRLSYGLPVFGFDPGRPRRVAYIAGESPHAITSWRIPAWELGHSIEAGRKPEFMLAKTMPLAYDISQYAETADQLLAQNFKPELLILDTVAETMAGMDDSSYKDASNFMLGVKLLREKIGCAVLALHHTKKDGSGERGSGAFVGSADAVAEITSWGETRSAAIQMKKVRDAELRSAPFTFQGTQVAKALVFRSTTPAEHAELTQQADMFSRAVVGKALLGAGALGRDKAIQTAVLADLMVPPQRHETVEQRAANIAKAAGVLNKLARASLRAYCDTNARNDNVWFLSE